MRVDTLESRYCGECQGYYPFLIEKAEEKWEKDGPEICSYCAIKAFQEVERAEIIIKERE